MTELNRHSTALPHRALDTPCQRCGDPARPLLASVRATFLALALVLLSFACDFSAPENDPDLAAIVDLTSDGSWPATTGDKGSRRYSPIDQIAASNVHRLEVAWRWSSST